ncbi:MAG: aminoacyl-tRNA hydrolase [Candidatus Kerfeldbacteria bacterium]
MKLVVGLGNPGRKYKKTRHNIGWRVLDELGCDFSVEKKFNANIAKCDDVIYCQPLTFMNNSGQAVRAVADYYKIDPREIILIYDDIDLPFGTIRLRSEGSAAGHNGMKSIIERLGTEAFSRIRIGIKPGHPVANTAHYVLGKFDRSQKKMLDNVIATALSELTAVLQTRLDRAGHRDISIEA